MMMCANCQSPSPISGSIDDRFFLNEVTEDHGWYYVAPHFLLCGSCRVAPLTQRIFMRLNHFPCLVCYENYDSVVPRRSPDPVYMHEFQELPDGVHTLNLDTGMMLYADIDNPIYNTPRPGGPRTMKVS